jgi:hypothetical protein
MAKTIIKASVYIITVLFLLWFIYSFIDVIMNNTASGIYWKYNAFVIMSNIRKGF